MWFDSDVDNRTGGMTRHHNQRPHDTGQHPMDSSDVLLQCRQDGRLVPEDRDSLGSRDR